MAEKFDLEYALQFSTSGENAAADALRTVEGLMTDLASKVEGAGSTFEKLAGNLATAENALRGVSSQARESAGSWDTFSAKVEASQKALESLMQTAAADGVQNPFESISQLIGDDEIDAFERSQDAQTNALQRASQARQEIRKQEADLAVAELQREQAIRDRELSELQNAIQERARAEAHGREQTNQTVIKSGEELDRIQQQARTQELTDLRSAIQERSSIQEQGYREVAASARQYYDELDSLRERDRQRELTSIRQGMQERARAEDERVREVSGRNYNNLSVQLDQEIESRRQASSVFAQESKARWESVAATESQEVATRDATGAIEGMTGSLPTLRYALYDIAQTAGVVTTALAGVATAAVVSSAQYETAFTAVERTSGVTGDAVGDLREQFLQLSREIPQSFADISNIGARGAQLGVATDNLKDFTETVAQFVATSDTVTLDQAVEAFGRISNLLGDQNFDRLGSAITLVGVNAAATEAQIVKTTQELAPFATAVGMATSDVIALSTAVASLGQPPERARSAFLTLQRVMDTAIADGSDNLHAFANLLGTTADEVALLWQSDPGAFVESFARALGGVENLTTAFADLGINERRAVQVFQALAADARNAGDGLSVLGTAMFDAARGYEENTELGRQYGLILDDLSSKWQLFKNAVGELTSTLGDEFAPIVKEVLDSVTGLIQEFITFTQTPIGRGITMVVAGFGALAFVVGTLITTVALLGASFVGTVTVMQHLNRIAGGAIFSVNGLRTAFRTLTAEIGLNTGALTANQAAMGRTSVAAGTTSSALATTSGVGRGLVNTFGRLAKVGGVVGGLVLVASAATNLQGTVISLIDTAEWLFQNIQGWTSGFKPVVGVMWGLAEALGWVDTKALETGFTAANVSQVMTVWGNVVANVMQAGANATSMAAQVIVNSLLAMTQAASVALGLLGVNMSGAVESVASLSARVQKFSADFSAGFGRGTRSVDTVAKGFFDQLRQGASLLPGASKGMSDLGGAAGGAVPSFEDLNGEVEDFGDNAGKAGKGAKGLGRELRSVRDYADDLQKVFGRAFEIQFGVRQSRDTTSSLLIKMREDAAAAQERVSDLRREIQGLNADLGKIDNDLSTQRYFLSIAVEYGDTARAEAIQANIAKLEADRAKTQADLAKTSKDLKDAQEATSTSLQGNSKYAIKNRETLDQLFESYQDQIVALANSGASQEEVRKASQRLREDFIKQATQLGYNVNELGEYEAAFRGLTTIIEQVPRNVSARLEINGLKPAVAALREFKVAAEEAQKAASKLGSGPSGGPGGVPSFTPDFTPTTQGLNIPYSYFPRDSQQLINQLNMDIAKGAHTVESAAQALGVSVGEATAMGIKTQADAQASSIIFGVNSGKSGAKKAGSDVGSATGTSMSGATAGVTSKLIPTGLVSSILGGQTASNQSGSQVGTSTGSAFSSSASSSARRGVPGGFKSAVDGSRRQARDGASSVGSAAGTSFSSGAGSGARRNFGGTISSAIFSAQFAVAREATNLGRTFASSITSSIRGSFNTALGVLSMARRIVRSITGFADGGYTGSGGKYEPAGIVHRGEYVIPKRDVNQATGMPYADALGRLMHGQRGYANGGTVGYAPSSSSGDGFTSLSPATIQALAAAIDPRVFIDGRMVGESASKFYTRESVNGAY